MSLDVNSIVESLKDEAPKLVKENKGALIGAVLGYLLTDSKEAQSALLGAIAGSVLADKKVTSETKDANKETE